RDFIPRRPSQYRAMSPRNAASAAVTKTSAMENGAVWWKATTAAELTSAPVGTTGTSAPISTSRNSEGYPIACWVDSGATTGRNADEAADGADAPAAWLRAAGRITARPPGARSPRARAGARPRRGRAGPPAARTRDPARGTRAGAPRPSR